MFEISVYEISMFEVSMFEISVFEASMFEISMFEISSFNCILLVDGKVNTLTCIHYRFLNHKYQSFLS